MSWQAVYRNFDDEALAALGSSGLLRRAAKDVEAGKVAWDAPPADAGGTLRADGQRVSVDGRGPAFARCDCPAPDVCKHILAAALWLRAAPPAASEAPAPAPGAEPDVLAEVLALDPAALFKAAGRAAVRKAAALLAQLGEAGIALQGTVLAIRLPGLDLEARYIAGAGFAGMLSEAAATSRAALHLLAIAAVWHAHGRTLPWPDEVAAAGTDAPAAGLAPDERRLLAQARALVVELSESGWSHVSDMAAPQLRALATSARVESLPQLAGLLRSLAGTAELLARRDYGADEGQALRLAARIAALAHALEHAPPSAAATLARLRGARQRSFAEGATLSLLPLGAHWWEQRSGARGLTAAFWDLDGGRVVQAVSARRDGSDPGFSRAGAWSLNPLWPGAAPPARLGGNVLLLESPRLSDDMRLALGGATRARTQAPLGQNEARWREAGYRDWSVLAAAVRGAAGLLGEGFDTVLLRPAAWDTPRLDEIRQQLCWTLADQRGAQLLLRMPYAPWKAERLSNLETWAASGQPIEAVLARLDRGGGAGLLEPLALAVAHEGTVRPVSLDFEAGPARPTLAARLGRLFGTRSAPAAVPALARPAHLRALAALLDLLEHKGMTGHLQHRDGAAELAELHRTLLAVGLDGIAAAIRRYADAPDAAGALALFHLAQTAADLDTGFLQG